MNCNIITTGIIPFIMYLIVWLLLNRYIKQRIPNKIERKQYKKENRLNKVLINTFIPLFVLSGIIILLLKNEVFGLYFIIKVLFLIASIVLAIYETKLLILILKELNNK